jgi:hypothetical protein
MHLLEGCPNNIYRGKLFAILPSKIKVKNQETTDKFKKLLEVHLQITLHPSIPPTAHINLVRQSL